MQLRGHITFLACLGLLAPYSGAQAEDNGQSIAALAAITGSVAGAVAASVSAAEQASADKHIAATSAAAAIAQTQIQADTTKHLAALQAEIAQQNLLATQEISLLQQQSSTERLELQLGALQREQSAQRRERAKIREIEQMRFDQQLALVREQIDAQTKLARLSINAQVLQTALNGGAIGQTTNRIATTTTGIGNISTASVVGNSSTLGFGSQRGIKGFKFNPGRKSAFASKVLRSNGLVAGSTRGTRFVLPKGSSDLKRFRVVSSRGLVRHPRRPVIQPQAPMRRIRKQAFASHSSRHSGRAVSRPVAGR